MLKFKVLCCIFIKGQNIINHVYYQWFCLTSLSLYFASISFCSLSNACCTFSLSSSYFVSTWKKKENINREVKVNFLKSSINFNLIKLFLYHAWRLNDNGGSRLEKSTLTNMHMTTLSSCSNSPQFSGCPGGYMGLKHNRFTHLTAIRAEGLKMHRSAQDCPERQGSRNLQLFSVIPLWTEKKM